MFIFFTNLDLFCIDNARVIYRKIRYISTFMKIRLLGAESFFMRTARHAEDKQQRFEILRTRLKMHLQDVV